MKEHRLVGALALIVLGLLASGLAHASQPWDTNIISWIAPTTCTTGEPITECAVTAYQVEESATQTGTFRVIASPGPAATSYPHTGVSAGQHCYRIFALSASGVSPPSNVFCKTNVKPPAGPPNAPVITVAEVIAGVGYSPVFAVLANGARSSTLGGLALVGTECDGPVLFSYRGKSWRKPVAFLPWSVMASALVAAPCA